MGHALLSPSGASKWLNCTPSARLELQFRDTAGQAAAEGTLAHALCELLLSYKLKQITKQKYQVELKKIEKDSLYSGDMVNHAEDYSLFVLERYAEAQARTKDALIFLEQRLDMTEYVPEGFGTGDCVIIADGIMDIIDLKYGKGVMVSATENKQMMLYSIGAMHAFDYLYDIHTVRMTIYQPRLDNYSSYEMKLADLREWAESELKVKAALAFKGEGEFNPGYHCKFCRAKPACRALAEYNLEMAKYDFAKSETLDDEEIADVLDRADSFKNWVKAVEEYALTQAVENGKHWPGYKLVEGRSNRKYTDESAVADRLISAGFEESKIYAPREVLGITAMEKAITKVEFAKHLQELVVKPQGKPTLVPLTDKRPELNSAEAAAADFANIS